MSFTFNETQLSILIPSNKRYLDWYVILQQELPKYGIDTKERVAAFIAQCGHESLDFTVLAENLNYSADALLRVFPKYFSSISIAQKYHRQPEKIANRVYSNRMGNDSEASGDGWKFRGRGLIQITGKSNYIEASYYIFNNDSVLSNPQYFSTVIGAVQSACWFWYANNCNEFADALDNDGLSRRINGGDHGLVDRNERYQKAMLVL
jgi:putative chitinase